VESAVARGAAYYGRVRRGAGLRIRAGSAHLVKARRKLLIRLTFSPS